MRTYRYPTVYAMATTTILLAYGYIFNIILSNYCEISFFTYVLIFMKCFRDTDTPTVRSLSVGKPISIRYLIRFGGTWFWLDVFGFRQPTGFSVSGYCW